MKIRRLRSSDLERERPIEWEHEIFPIIFLEISKTIIELNISSHTSDEVINKIELLLTILRLFKFGAVNYIKIELYPKSILSNSPLFYININFYPDYEYILKESDIHIFNVFLNKIACVLQEEVMEKSSSMKSNISIGVHRYNESLLKADSVKAKITYAISCLEALYMRGGEEGEFSHKFSQRVSLLLRIFRFNPLCVYRIVKDAYQVRSRYSHGLLIKIKKLKFKDLLLLTKLIINYTRISLLIFLQLKYKIKKKDLIKKIDNSLLHEKSNLELNKFIKKNVKFISKFLKN